MKEYTIVVTDDRHLAYAEEQAVLKDINGRLVVKNCGTAEEVREAVQDADGVLCNLAPMPAAVFASMKKCRVVSRYGVGYDNVDVEAATAKGIYVANVPDYCVEDVSDHTLALLLACVRKIPRLDRGVRQGLWLLAPKEDIRRIKGKTYGLIGYGLIARTLHRKLGGLGLDQVLVYDPFVDEVTIKKAGGTPTSLENLCRNSDYISIHTPLNKNTRSMISRPQFEIMKSSAILINVSRGPVVDERALVEALENRTIHMAGLDVFETEPPGPDNPLLKLENVVLSDHAGYYSRESFAELKTKAAQNIVQALSGKRPLYAINHPTGKEE